LLLVTADSAGHRRVFVATAHREQHHPEVASGERGLRGSGRLKPAEPAGTWRHESAENRVTPPRWWRDDPANRVAASACENLRPVAASACKLAAWKTDTGSGRQLSPASWSRTAGTTTLPTPPSPMRSATARVAPWRVEAQASGQ